MNVACVWACLLLTLPTALVEAAGKPPATPADGSAQPVADRLVVLAADPEDPRIELVRDAARFWNATFKGLELGRPLPEPTIVVQPRGLRRYETYARKIAYWAGRPQSGRDDPDLPTELRGLDREVVVLLSRQRLMPFAWPLGASSYFVGLPRRRSAEVESVREIAAHELGHVLGLTHHDDPAGLMCFPCRPDGGESSIPALTERVRDRLIELHRR